MMMLMLEVRERARPLKIKKRIIVTQKWQTKLEIGKRIRLIH
jgi:hypothetical protein